jgi:hypothetical protein
MTLFTPNYSFPFPELSDTPDGATQMGNLATAVDTALHSTDATVATNGTRATLLATLLGTSGVRYTHFTSATTVAGLTVTTPTALVDTSGNSCGHTFVAPPSGIVRIAWGANILSGTTGSTVFVGTDVKTGGTVGSGTAQSAVSDDESFTTSSTSRVPGARERFLTGLTSGSTYNVRLMWRNSGSTTSTATTPWCVTVPVLA